MPETKLGNELINILKPRWINSDPLLVSAPLEEGGNSIYIISKMLKDKLVLIDFWDYSCINCVRTIPYINRWYARYADLGLVVIGVHTPEFSVTADRKNLAKAVKKLGITYPVVMDNDYGIWTGFQNQNWPRKLLLNRRLEVIHDYTGEGNYAEFEAKIQHSLLEMNPDFILPHIMEPIRSTDIPGARCYPVTPELYCGFIKGKLGNREGYNEDNESVFYTLPEQLDKDALYLNGTWAATEESIVATAVPASVEFSYSAAEVNAVMACPENIEIKVYVRIDKKPVAEHIKGDDISYDKYGSYIPIRQPRMYSITKGQPYGRFSMALSTGNAALEIFAFTFVSCVEPN